MAKKTRRRGKVLKGLHRFLMPIVDLVPDPRNARHHDERNLETIAASLKTFGQHVPLVASASDMVVRVGNGRLEAAKRLGWTHIAAVVVDESEVSAVARAIADNRTGELSEWDIESLEKTLAALERAGVDLQELGWTEEELRGLVDGFPVLESKEKTTKDGEPAEATAEVDLIVPVGETDAAIELAEGALAGFEGIEIEQGDNVVEETA